MQNIGHLSGFSRGQGIQILDRLPGVARDTDLIPVAYPAHPGPVPSFHRVKPRRTKPRVRQKIGSQAAGINRARFPKKRC
jgi:hypothetical protein